MTLAVLDATSSWESTDVMEGVSLSCQHEHPAARNGDPASRGHRDTTTCSQ